MTGAHRVPPRVSRPVRWAGIVASAVFCGLVWGIVSGALFGLVPGVVAGAAVAVVLLLLAGIAAEALIERESWRDLWARDVDEQPQGNGMLP